MSDDAPAFAVFPGEPCRVQDARRWAAVLLSRAGADLEAAELLASELVTNALLHTLSGEPGGTVTVIVTPGGVLHVHDLGPAGPGPCAGPGGWAPGAERADFGKGLLLVAVLGAGLVHGPAAACPAAWRGDPAMAGGCCTRCVPAVRAAAPDAAPLKGQPSATAA
jgi:hypothetical protein